MEGMLVLKVIPYRRPCSVCLVVDKRFVLEARLDRLIGEVVFRMIARPWVIVDRFCFAISDKYVQLMHGTITYWLVVAVTLLLEVLLPAILLPSSSSSTCHHQKP